MTYPQSVRAALGSQEVRQLITERIWDVLRDEREKIRRALLQKKGKIFFVITQQNDATAEQFVINTSTSTSLQCADANSTIRTWDRRVIFQKINKLLFRFSSEVNQILEDQRIKLATEVTRRESIRFLDRTQQFSRTTLGRRYVWITWKNRWPIINNWQEWINKHNHIYKYLKNLDLDKKLNDFNKEKWNFYEKYVFKIMTEQDLIFTQQELHNLESHEPISSENKANHQWLSTQRS